MQEYCGVSTEKGEIWKNAIQTKKNTNTIRFVVIILVMLYIFLIKINSFFIYFA